MNESWLFLLCFSEFQKVRKDIKATLPPCHEKSKPVFLKLISVFFFWRGGGVTTIEK